MISIKIDEEVGLFMEDAILTYLEQHRRDFLGPADSPLEIEIVAPEGKRKYKVWTNLIIEEI